MIQTIMFGLAAVIFYVLLAGVTWRFLSTTQRWQYPEAAAFWPVYWIVVLAKITIVPPLVAVFRLGAGRKL